MNANIYKITVGVIGDDWDLDLNDGLVYATDPSTLGADVVTIEMCKIETEDGAIFISNGETHAFEDKDDFFSFADSFALPGLSEQQNRKLRGILFIDDDADYDLDTGEWDYTLGEMGEVRLASEDYRNAMVVNVTPWYDAEFELDKDDLYGVSINEEEGGVACDEHEFCGVYKNPGNKKE